jgi:hypothetical protein
VDRSPRRAIAARRAAAARAARRDRGRCRGRAHLGTSRRARTRAAAGRAFRCEPARAAPRAARIGCSPRLGPERSREPNRCRAGRSHLVRAHRGGVRGGCGRGAGGRPEVFAEPAGECASVASARCGAPGRRGRDGRTRSASRLVRRGVAERVSLGSDSVSSAERRIVIQRLLTTDAELKVVLVAPEPTADVSRLVALLDTLRFDDYDLRGRSPIVVLTSDRQGVGQLTGDVER